MRILGILLLALGVWGFFRPVELTEMIKKNFYRNPAAGGTPPKKTAAAEDGSSADRQRLLMVRMIALLWAVVGLVIVIKG